MTNPVGVNDYNTTKPSVNTVQQKGVPDYQQAYLTGFFTQVLIDAGLPVNGTNIAVLKAQSQQEGSSAAYNPLDLENATQNKLVPQYDPQGVSNFSSAQQGAAATAKVILQKNMSAFANALRGNTGSSSTPDLTAAAHTAQTGLGGSDWLGGGAGSTANQAYGTHVANLVSLNGINAQHLGPTALEQAAMAVPNPVGDLASQVSGLMGNLTSVSFWTRVLLVVGGFVLIMAGVKALAAGDSTEHEETPAQVPYRNPGTGGHGEGSVMHIAKAGAIA